MTLHSDLHTFADPTLLERALTHPSWSNEHPGSPNNQRMEFLGDSVLQLIVSELLLDLFPTWDEGSLSKARSKLVKTESLCVVSRSIGLGDSLRAERGLLSRGELGDNVLADTFEAFVAAVYLDGGLDRARAVVVPLLGPAARALTPDVLKDAKSRLQEWCQARRLPLPVYVDLGRTGPPHDTQHHVAVDVDGRRFGPATSAKIKSAEAEAALLALDVLDR